jgi:guanine deaminase
MDFGRCLIIPGLVDLHLHAPQYAIRGMGMDLELIPWLNQYAFAEESKYADVEYAAAAYRAFCDALKSGATTHAAVFASLHVPATEMLMDMLEASGLVTYVGKVNMDRNCPAHLVEKSCDSALDTERWIRRSMETYKNTRPIITPRFVPSCSEELMAALGGLAAKYHVPIQSHLSENLDEIRWVKEMHPDIETYSDVYDHFGLFGQEPTIMAHCVYLTDSEMELVRERGVLVAHCPESNINISSGIAPVRRMLDKGIKVGLGTDVAGGFSISMFRAITDAIQASKMYAVLIDRNQAPLTLSEAFYLATKGGGSFWGKVGSFEPEYEMSAVVIDDSDISFLSPLTVSQRLERVVHLSEGRHIKAKYVKGVPVL